MKRGKFLDLLSKGLAVITTGTLFGAGIHAATSGVGHGQKMPRYAMGIQVDQCIGCGTCVTACKNENDVPRDFFHFRTWVERYILRRDGQIHVQSIDGGATLGRSDTVEQDVLSSFFVPKLCNHCDHPPCAQVCPVGATFQTEDGIVLVDKNRCIGCSYCIQACPYGARYMHPESHTADKCTLCYHRINQGLLPACVEVCPTQTRVFGNLESNASPLVRLKRMHHTHVLKPELNTEPKVFYTQLDGKVR